MGIFLAILFSIFLNKYLNKVVVIQFILAIISLLSFAQNNYAISNKWKNLPDDILNINFKKKPNIYFIQPDGYVNFSELKGENYNTDFTDFENYLADNGFTYYYDFRSNYYSTLSSNSATFNMKHHYYNDKPQLSEVLNARNNIVSENAVLSIFKQNGYSTHFISELPYLLLNKTKLGFDTSNFIDDEISYISKGLGKPVDILNPLKKEFFNKSDLSKFFFIEFFNPGHITANKRYSKGKELEKKETANRLSHVPNEHVKDIDSLFVLEREIIRILLLYGNEAVTFIDYIETENEKGYIEIQEELYENTISKELYLNLQEDEIAFTNPIFQSIYFEIIHQLNQSEKIVLDAFITHENQDIATMVTTILMDDEKYFLSNWERKNIYVVETKEILPKLVTDAILNIRRILIHRKINDLMNEAATENNATVDLQLVKDYTNLKKRLYVKLKRVV